MALVDFLIRNPLKRLFHPVPKIPPKNYTLVKVVDRKTFWLIKVECDDGADYAVVVHKIHPLTGRIMPEPVINTKVLRGSIMPYSPTAARFWYYEHRGEFVPVLSSITTTPQVMPADF